MTAGRVGLLSKESPVLCKEIYFFWVRAVCKGGKIVASNGDADSPGLASKLTQQPTPRVAVEAVDFSP